MPTITLTAKMLENLKVAERPGQRVEYFDETVPGFGVRITHDGHRTFTFLYRWRGKKCRINLGTHPPLSLKDARDAAKLAWAEVQQGRDPRALQTSRDPGEISRGNVREWAEQLATQKPVVANRAFSIMRRVYTRALGRDLVASTPFVGIHKPAVETARDRVLTPDEIEKVFSALRHERPIIAALSELPFYTGVRPGTALNARWADVKFDRKVWEVPVTKRARGNPEGRGRPFVVPLSPQAVAVLELLKPFSAHSDFVFPGGSPRRSSLDTERPRSPKSV